MEKNLETSEKKRELIPLEFQGEIEKFLPRAGTIQLTPAQENILYDVIKDEEVEIRPDGLIYLPWMEYASRLRRAFGLAWVMIPQGLPKIQDEMIFWGFHLIIQGNFAGFAIGEQKYQSQNAQMTYGDACEGAKSNALMRLCKGIGIGIELWRPSYVKTWKEKYGELYPGIWPDGKPIKDKNGKQKMLWRKKNENTEIDIEFNNNISSTKSISLSIEMIFDLFKKCDFPDEYHKNFELYCLDRFQIKSMTDLEEEHLIALQATLLSAIKNENDYKIKWGEKLSTYKE